MKKLFCIAIILTVIVNVNTFSATKKSSSKSKITTTKKAQPEVVQIAINTVNNLMKRYYDSFETTQNWVYNNSKFTDDFKSEYSNHIIAIKIGENLCHDLDDSEEYCTYFEDLSLEEQNFYENYGFSPFLSGQDTPDSVEFLHYNSKDGYVIAKGKNWDSYIMYIKVVNENGEWKVDGAARINIPKHLQAGLGEVYFELTKKPY